MKCKNCGGEMDSKSTHCPYCNSENQEGIQFQQEVKNRLSRYFFLKPFILKKKAPELIYKYMTGMVCTFLGINFLLFLIIVGIFFIEEKILEPKEPKNGVYATKFGDYEIGEFYVYANQLIENNIQGESVDEYYVELLLDHGTRILRNREEKEKQYPNEVEFVEEFLRGYFALTEEEMQYIKENEDSYYLDSQWKERVAERIIQEMEEEAWQVS